MEHSEFEIGTMFWRGGGQWRCTDVGTRTITAVRIDRVEIHDHPAGSLRVLCCAEAEEEGWFNGPPYAVAETVFDEDDIEGCSPATENIGK
jgi:hypothetical protein